MHHKVKHVLGISGGKDSAALAIYLNDKYPAMDVEYYSCDTGKKLDELYQLIKNLEIYLGKSIKVLNGVGDCILSFKVYHPSIYRFYPCHLHSLRLEVGYDLWQYYFEFVDGLDAIMKDDNRSFSTILDDIV